MGRSEDWAEQIRAALALHGDADRLQDWQRVPIWTAGRPYREDGADVKACVADRLWQRVGVSERYVREIANGEPSTPTRWE